ncbi:MAG: sugar transferase [Acidimicrobiaceae bacterium TMED210]|nr:MAG: sugar transferase [Acidimicrobiaceae bacterium TMED210]|tara:strand:+ start:3091 stop:3708 length:618 start_codon:yes stop_codon:yes gene_type:complete
MKYFIDIVLLFFALPLFLFFYPIISLLILIFDGTPILYSQLRVGLYGNEFKLYKFRTMSILSDDSVHQNHYENLSENKKIEPSLTPDNPIRIENDDRITKVGNILRKTSLDELPNIINVLIGNMSFVGPRPLVKYESDLYGKYLEERNSVKPGITGLAQIQGRLDLSLQERLYWDLQYVKSKSFIYDFKIIIKTVYSVLSRRGAN